MKKNASLLGLALSLLFSLQAEKVSAQDRRTDGPPGSEYADFSNMRGQLSIGGHFGALLPSTGNGSSFLVGADADFRPYDLFGLRFTYHQGLQSPRGSVFALTPVVYSEFSNLIPYAFFGPGIAITNNRGGTKLKFSISMGAGADVLLIDHFGVGMLYMYNALLDSPDFHDLGARISYWF